MDSRRRGGFFSKEYSCSEDSKDDSRMDSCEDSFMEDSDWIILSNIRLRILQRTENLAGEGFGL